MSLTMAIQACRSTDVSIKSLYDDKYVYFLISYKDPTKSLARFPWVKQADGILEKDWPTRILPAMTTPITKTNWPCSGISAPKGFEDEGCMIACHLNETGDKSPGRKYTASAE